MTATKRRALKPDRECIAEEMLGSELYRHPALFVFRTAKGLVWVGDNYLDVWSARPADHWREGRIEVEPDRWRVVGPDGACTTIMSLESVRDREFVEHLRDPFRWARQVLAEKGVTLAQERARVRKVLGL